MGTQDPAGASSQLSEPCSRRTRVCRLRDRGHSPSVVPSYTGCLTNGGTITDIQPGNVLRKDCDQKIHLSGGDQSGPSDLSFQSLVIAAIRVRDIQLP